MQETVSTSKDSQLQHVDHGLPRRLNVDRIKPLSRVVYIDEAQVDAVAQELNSTVKILIQYHASCQMLADHRVLLFNRKVLRNQERLEDISELEWRRAVVGGVLSGCD